MKTYCINYNCPFKSCGKHLKHCRAKKGKISVANYDGTCREYIAWLVGEAEFNNKFEERKI